MIIFAIAMLIFGARPGLAQQKLKLAYASVDTTNAVWYVAKERECYQKHGLEVDLIFIPSSTTNIAALIAGDVQIANGVASNVASMAVGGVTLVMPACLLSTLAYDFVVNDSIKTAADLRGKNVGISRVGSASDVAAQVFLRALGLEPNKESSYLGHLKLFERVPLVNRQGVETQIKEPWRARLVRRSNRWTLPTTVSLSNCRRMALSSGSTGTEECVEGSWGQVATCPHGLSRFATSPGETWEL